VPRSREGDAHACPPSAPDYETLLCILLLAGSLAHADTTLPPGPVIGIGTELRSADHQPVVGTVLPGSPADKAGVRPGDRFLRIDDSSVSKLSLVEIAVRLRGAVGSPVRLTVLRHGNERTFKMQREILLLPGSHLPQ
jgi:C-terminal processing protease CtpA/Prc